MPSDFTDTSLLIQSKNLYDSLQVYYRIFDASKKAIYSKFIAGSDYSAFNLRNYITHEALCIDKVNSMSPTGVSGRAIRSHMLEVYKDFKKVDQNVDLSTFYRLGILRNSVYCEDRQAIFYISDITILDNGLIIGKSRGTITLELPDIKKIVDGKRESGFILHKIAFKNVGAAYIDSKEIKGVTEHLTEVILTYSISEV